MPEKFSDAEVKDIKIQEKKVLRKEGGRGQD
jgi:hypothetical protein